MQTFELIITFFASGFFIALIGMFYRLGLNQSKIEMSFKRIDERFDQMEKKNDERFDKLEKKLEKMDEKLLDLDRRLCRLEGAFSSKDCCMIKDDSRLKKAE